MGEGWRAGDVEEDVTLARFAASKVGGPDFSTDLDGLMAFWRCA